MYLTLHCTPSAGERQLEDLRRAVEDLDDPTWVAAAQLADDLGVVPAFAWARALGEEREGDRTVDADDAHRPPFAVDQEPVLELSLDHEDPLERPARDRSNPASPTSWRSTARGGLATW